MNILMIEQPLNNRGDESAHRGLVRRLLAECPGVRLTVLFWGQKKEEIDSFRVESDRVDYVNIPLGVQAKRLSRYFMRFTMPWHLHRLLYVLPVVRRFSACYRSADFVLCAPGGINMGGFRDWPHLAFLTLARMERKPVIYYGRSIGPFTTRTFFARSFRRQSVALLRGFSFVSLRDKRSQDIARQLGVTFEPTIDSAFLWNEQAAVPADVARAIGGAPCIAFVPNSLAWHFQFRKYTFDEVRGFWVKLLERLAEAYPGHRIVMLPQTVGYSRQLPDGYRYFCEIGRCSTVDPARVVVVPEAYGSDVQQAIIAQADFLVGARYHSVVFAINQGVPFVSLSYEHKMNGVVELVGRRDDEVELATLCGSQTGRRFDDRLVEEIVARTRRLRRDPAATAAARAMAGRCFDRLKATLGQ